MSVKVSTIGILPVVENLMDGFVAMGIITLKKLIINSSQKEQKS